MSGARYGIKRREFYEPEEDGHRGYRPYIDYLSKVEMIDVIAYHMMRVSKVQDGMVLLLICCCKDTVTPSTGAVSQHGKLRCIHDFPCNSQELLAREIIYINYTTEDCYSGYPLEASFNQCKLTNPTF